MYNVVGWFYFEVASGFEIDLKNRLHPPKDFLDSLSFISQQSLWLKRKESISNAFLLQSKSSGSLTSSKE